MRTKKIPSIFFLMIFSWAVCVLGLLAGGYLIISRAFDLRSIVYGALIVLAGFFVALLIRVFGNIAQMIFDQNKKLEELKQRLVGLDKLDQLDKLDKLDRLDKLDKLDRLDKLDKLDRLDKLDKLDRLDKLDKLDQLEKLNKLDRLDKLDKLDQLDKLDKLDQLSQVTEHISCDSKDVSQNTHQIKGFFEQIQKHLDLNK